MMWKLFTSGMLKNLLVFFFKKKNIISFTITISNDQVAHSWSYGNQRLRQPKINLKLYTVTEYLARKELVKMVQC